MGTIGGFQFMDGKYGINVDFVWTDGKVYLDFTAPVDKEYLMDWIETSVIGEENTIDNLLLNKNRGCNRTHMDSKVNGNNDFTWIRYAVDNPCKYPHKLVIFNPVVIHQLTINLIEK